MELVLNTFGASLSRDNEGFLVSVANSKQRIPVQGITSIIVSKGIQITSDAILLAIDNEIDILFSEKGGSPKGRVWSSKYGSISTIRKGQINFVFSKEAVTWIKEVICKKIENQQAILLMMRSDELKRKYEKEKAIARLEDYRDKINRLNGEIVQDIASNLRGWEGVASKIYFEAIKLFIPDEYQFKERSQHPAKDVVNALFNYGYGILYGKIEGCLIKAGIDPYVGILHRDDYNRPVLAFDIIELYRVWIDYIVINLVSQRIINEEFYSVKEDGSYWLENLGRRIMIQSVNDYLAEVVKINNLERSRENQMQLYAHSLAKKFKDFQ